MKKRNFVSFENVHFQDGFWSDRYNLNKRVSIPNVRMRFEESGRFDAMRFNFLKNGRRPHIFFDSDVAKWMEGVAYLIQTDPDSMKEHEALCEELIAWAMHSARMDISIPLSNRFIPKKFSRRAICMSFIVQAI